MKSGLLISPWAILICVCSTFAQVSSDTPTASPLTPIEEVIQSSPSRGGGSASRDSNLWVSADYMASWIHSASLPPLVTTSPATTDRTVAGILGTPGTSTLFGNHADGGFRSGARLGAGYWFDAERTCGIEASFVAIESQAAVYSNGSNGSTILARPYTDATTGLPQAVLVAFPGSSAGSINVRAETGNFYTGNLDLTERIYDSGSIRLTTMGGYRYYGYDESLGIVQNISPTSGLFVPGTNIVSADRFQTRNQFHGMDLGLRSEFFWRSLSLEVLTKFAVGDLRTVTSINGIQTTTVPGTAPVFNRGGVYALPTNSASFVNNFWGTLPEVGTSLKWQIRPYLQARLGYSLYLLDSVARAGNQVTTTINPANFPPATGPAGSQPIFSLSRSNIWVQSATFGLAFTY